MKMMTLPQFTAEYGIARPTVIDWIGKEKGFAGRVAHKINSK